MKLRVDHSRLLPPNQCCRRRLAHCDADVLLLAPLLRMDPNELTFAARSDALIEEGNARLTRASMGNGSLRPLDEPSPVCTVLRTERVLGTALCSCLRRLEFLMLGDSGWTELLKDSELGSCGLITLDKGISSSSARLKVSGDGLPLVRLLARLPRETACAVSFRLEIGARRSCSAVPLRTGTCTAWLSSDSSSSDSRICPIIVVPEGRESCCST